MTNREIDQRALLIAKDAEIEQLKESAKYDAFLREKYRGLITELCDALEGHDWQEGFADLRKNEKLIQQGREATR
jgi:hypothetical protein